MYRLSLLGTGNAAGMPVYGCECAYCSASGQFPERKRQACSALLNIGKKQYLIDAGLVNLHEHFPAGSLHGILITHFHPDHVQGLFHLRWGKNLHIPVFIPPDSEGCADLFKHPGILAFRKQRKYQSFWIDDLKVTPLPLIHSKPTFGYLLECPEWSIAYLTDTKGLPPSTECYLAERPLDCLIVDCSYPPGHEGKGHNNLDDVLAIQSQLLAKQVVLTHIGHDFDVWLSRHPDCLPDEFVVARDGYDVTACLRPG